MRNRSIPAHVLAALLCALALSSVPLSAQDVVSLRVRFGLLDTTETRWDGSVSVSEGKLVRIADWHPRPENHIDPSGTWKLSTHKGVNYNWRPYENLPDRPVMPYYWTPGVILDLRSGPGAKVRVKTAQGDFAFSVGDAGLGKALEFL